MRPKFQKRHGRLHQANYFLLEVGLQLQSNTFAAVASLPIGAKGATFEHYFSSHCRSSTKLKDFDSNSNSSSLGILIQDHEHSSCRFDFAREVIFARGSESAYGAEWLLASALSQTSPVTWSGTSGFPWLSKLET